MSWLSPPLLATAVSLLGNTCAQCYHIPLGEGRGGKLSNGYMFSEFNICLSLRGEFSLFLSPPRPVDYMSHFILVHVSSEKQILLDQFRLDAADGAADFSLSLSLSYESLSKVEVKLFLLRTGVI